MKPAKNVVEPWLTKDLNTTNNSIKNTKDKILAKKNSKPKLIVVY